MRKSTGAIGSRFAWFLIVICFACGLFLVMAHYRGIEPPKALPPAPEGLVKSSDLAKKAAVLPKTPQKTSAAAKGGKPFQKREMNLGTREEILAKGGSVRIALVVDDLGFSKEGPKRLAHLKLPLTWSILPYQRETLESARLAESKHIPYLLHLPMQAEVDGPKGPFLVGVGLPDELLARRVESALDSLPGAVGVNNHRGSRATADRHTMEVVMEVIARHRLFFLDSRTSSKSVAEEVAREKGVRTLGNALFLDNDPSEERIASEFDTLIRRARHRGYAVAICHVRPTTLEFLEQLDGNRPSGVVFVTLPDLVSILDSPRSADQGKDQGNTKVD